MGREARREGAREVSREQDEAGEMKRREEHEEHLGEDAPTGRREAGRKASRVGEPLVGERHGGVCGGASGARRGGCLVVEVRAWELATRGRAKPKRTRLP